MKKKLLALLLVMAMLLSNASLVFAKDAPKQEIKKMGGMIQTAEERNLNLPYTDVSETDWFYPFVGFMYDLQLMKGLTPTTFGPNETLSRGQFVTILYRFIVESNVPYVPVFKDVPAGQFYTDAAIWGYATGIMSGYADGRFGPADPVTREQVVTTLYRFADYYGFNMSAAADLSQYGDRGNVSAFAVKPMTWAVGSGVITGDGGLLNPQGTANRAVCATIITRFVVYYEDEFTE